MPQRAKSSPVPYPLNGRTYGENGPTFSNLFKFKLLTLNIRETILINFSRLVLEMISSTERWLDLSIALHV